jgi:tetratricopeptide (TPR) repeat protein
MLLVDRPNVGSMTGGWQRVRRAVLATATVTIVMGGVPAGAAADEAVTAQCAKRPTPPCIIDAGMSTMRAMKDHPDVYADVLMGQIIRTLVNARIAIGDLEGAHALATSLRDVKEPHVYQWALESVAIAEARTGDLDEAIRLLDSIEDDSRAGLLIAIADRQATEGNKADAQQTLASALDRKGAARSESARVFTLIGAAKVMDHLGDKPGAAAAIGDARKIADGLSREVFRSVSLSVVASTYAETGDLDTALSIARSIPRNAFRAGALISVVEAATRQKKSIDAGGLIAEALAIAREDAFPVSRANSLGEIAVLQWSLGDHAAADRTIEEALRVTESAKGGLDHASALQAVAIALARSGNAARGLEIVARIDMAPERALAFFDMASALAIGY